jgi:hypothetical protein
MYKIYKNSLSQNCVARVNNDDTTTSFGFDPANTDYAQFKKDILDGAELLDADGQVMDAIQFVKEVP